MKAFTDTDGPTYGAIEIAGTLGEPADTTKTTGGYGIVRMRAAVKSGTADGVAGTDANLFSIDNGGTTRFIFDAEGSGHADVEWTTYDAEDDIQILKDVEATLVPDIFGQAVRYKEDDLVRLGLFGEGSIRQEPNGKMRGMMNETKMIMAHHGAITQLYDWARAKILGLEREVKLLKEVA